MKETNGVTPPTRRPKARIVVVDPVRVVREYLRTTLAQMPEYEVVGEGATGAEALQMCRRLKPDVIITELHLPQMGAGAVLGHLREAGLRVRMLIYTAVRKGAALLAALRFRPHGIVNKEDSLPALWGAVAALARGSRYIGAGYAEQEEEAGKGLLGLELDARELTMLQMIAEGDATKVIAAQLGLAEKTAERMRQRLMKKAGAKNVIELMDWAKARGLIHDDSPPGGNG